MKVIYNTNMNKKNAKILIVEDEKSINRLIELVLKSDGFYNIQKAFDGREAFEIIRKSKPDLILLDIMLPETDGLTLSKKIKSDEFLNDIQIIMLTAKKMENDVLAGFENGAIDYITKPFSNKILLARVNAHLKQLQNTNKDSVLYLDFNNSSVVIRDSEIKLTNFEFKLMQLFTSNKGRTFSRAKLLYYLRGDGGYDVSERAMDVQIVNLRKKIGTEYIETVRGIGYKFNVEN